MAFRRAFIDIGLAVDLDDIAGNFNNPQDFVTFLEQTVKQSIPHYKPEVKAKSITTKPYVWNEDKMDYIQPTWDSDRKPKVGDKVYLMSKQLGTIVETDVETLPGLEVDVKIYVSENLYVSENPWVYAHPSDLFWDSINTRWNYTI